MSRVIGIDLYHEDQEPDWKKLKEHGVSFVFLKIGQGVLVDPKFHEWKADCAFAGIPCGGYWFFDTRYTAFSQFSVLRSATGKIKFDLPVAVDIERNTGDIDPEALAHRLEVFLQYVDSLELYPGKPLIYTSPSYWDDTIPAEEAMRLAAKYGLWVSHYTAAPQPRLPKGWKQWAFWQVAAGEGGSPVEAIALPTANGKTARYDTNIFHGDAQMLAALTKGDHANA
jgi:lysozyme